MKRWWLVVLLLLSVGLNLGLLAQRARAEKKARAMAVANEPAPSSEPAPGEKVPPEMPAGNPDGGPLPHDPRPHDPQPHDGPPPHDPPHDLPPNLQPGERRPPHEKPPFLVRLMDRMANEVGVEGEQREKFLAIQQGFFESTFETREELRRRQQALRQNLVSSHPHRALAERQVEALSQAQKKLEQAFINNYFETTAILDGDQQKRYRRVILELRKMRWERGGREDVVSPNGSPNGPPQGEGPRQRRRERREAWEREREGREGEPRERPPGPPGGG